MEIGYADKFRYFVHRNCVLLQFDLVYGAIAWGWFRKYEFLLVYLAGQ